MIDRTPFWLPAQTAISLLLLVGFVRFAGRDVVEAIREILR